jgi:hypothetical protein
MTIRVSNQPGKKNAIAERTIYIKTKEPAALIRVNQPRWQRPKRIEPPSKMKTQTFAEKIPAIAATRFRIQVSIKDAPFLIRKYLSYKNILLKKTNYVNARARAKVYYNA